jgi:dTDP-4-amino-4,6-dideoxygalactose transaminase
MRAHVARELDVRGIQTTHYPALTKLSAFRDHEPRPRTEELAARHLLLPLSSTYTGREVDVVVDELIKVLAASGAAAH